MDNSTAAPATGLVANLIGTTRNSIGLLLCRLELAMLELSEVRNHLLKLLLVAALALLAVGFAVAYGTALIVYLTWENLGWKILGILSLAFAGLSIGLLRYACGMVRQGKLSLPATMAELKTDRDTLL